MTTDPQQLRAGMFEALLGVREPDTGCGVLELNMVRRCEVSDRGGAEISLEIRNEEHTTALIDAVQKALAPLDFTGVQVSFAIGEDTRRPPAKERQWIPGVRNVIGIGAGKGGVGKSTISVNLALALSQRGARVGLLDGDIYGPNIPLMLGLTGQRPVVEGEKIIPLEAHGLKVMSLGMLIEEDQPVVWRGPMLHTAVGQFLFDVAWGELDHLIIDMPPGTGDVSLSLSQKTPVTGAVAVCTPSLVAVQDVRKAIGMFRMLEMPVLGLVENMRGFACPKCGEITQIFDEGEAERTAEAMQVAHLGHIPLHTALREGGDTGRPVQAVDPEGSVADRFRAVAEALALQVARVNFENLREKDLVQIQM